MRGKTAGKGIMGVAEVDLPREKLERSGPEGLQSEELLAILLRTGYEGRNVLEVSQKVLAKHPPEELVMMDLASLTCIKGIGRAKAAGLVAAFELSRRALNSGMGIEPAITRPGDIVSVIADIKGKRKEHFLAVFLNARNQVICREEVSIGSLNASLVQTRDVRPIGRYLGYHSGSGWW